MELQGLLQHILDGKNEPKELCHVVIPLLGEFKGERGEWWHLLLLSDVTESGFKPQLWAEWVAAMLRGEGKHHGLVMCDEDGNLLSTAQVEDEFHAQLICVQATHPHLLHASVDVTELHGLSRSPCQGSLSCATDQGVPKELCNLQNRWKSIEAKQGSW
eukprot:14707645-Ditylum_brightwellii.AAC.1